MSIQLILENFSKNMVTDDNPDVIDFIHEITRDPGSYIVTNHHIFYAMSQIGWNKNLLKALKDAKRYTGP